MKIIRRLEELDGLENGKGLKLIVLASPYKECVWLKIFFENLAEILVEIKEIENFNESDIRLLEAMGFEFEWKPKRTLEEVLHSYSTMFFVPNEKNYLILEKDGRYSVSYSFHKSIGTSYYLKKDAEKICEELNS